MASIPDFLVKLPIDIPNRSGFDMSYENHLSGRCGTLMPVFCKEVFPNETHSLGCVFDCELPPMVSNFKGKIDMVFEAFYVPNRLLYGGWEQFATHPTDNPQYPEGTPVELKPHKIPQVRVNYEEMGFGPNPLLKRGSLADMLGIKQSASSDNTTDYYFNSLPFLAYHRIYDDHYRNTLVQTPVFTKPSSTLIASGTESILNNPLVYAPYDTLVNTTSQDEIDNTVDFSLSDSLVDGVRLGDLRQRNWDIDYFTSVTPSPQAGGPVSLNFNIDVASETGSFSIASLRESNALQKWLERNNLAGYDYGDQVYAQYGCYPDARQLTKSLYLGRYSELVYNRSVFQQSPNTDSTVQTRNPFQDVGARFGASQSNGSGSLFDNFKVTDHGYIIVMASMRPRAYYSTGVDKKMLRKYIGDIPFPLLSTVGDQPVYNYELAGFGQSSSVSNSIFGWTDRYAEVKCSLDEVHGELVDGGMLDAFVIQRSFDPDESHVISDDFLEIDMNYLDQVKQITSALVPVDYWMDIWFAFKKVSPFPVYSVPTLGDLKNVHYQTMKKGGSQL